jgi:hypothetical protein
MSCVAEVKAVTQNSANVMKNKGVCAMVSPVVCGSRNGSMSIATDISICMVIIHHLLLLMISTKGLHRGFITHGKYNMLVYRASIPFGMPMFLNMTTDMLLTMKYGIPSAK